MADTCCSVLNGIGAGKVCLSEIAACLIEPHVPL
jgi:hypothetical protein